MKESATAGHDLNSLPQAENEAKRLVRVRWEEMKATTSNAQRSTLNVQCKECFLPLSVGRWVLGVGRCAFAAMMKESVTAGHDLNSLPQAENEAKRLVRVRWEEMKATTSNAQRSTLNAQRPMQGTLSAIERWTLGVGRWTFAAVMKESVTAGHDLNSLPQAENEAKRLVRVRWEEMKATTSNAQRSTLNVQCKERILPLSVGRWTLDVGRLLQ